MSNKIDLSGRSAVVTGGGRGIGRAIVERFLDSGAGVAIWDCDKSLAEQAARDLAGRGHIVAITVDVADYGMVEQARDTTMKAFGRVDILVNNAGIGGSTQATWEYPLGAWRRIMAVNFDGAFFCCRALIPGMIASNYGRIVNIASVAGKEGNPKMAAYSCRCSKIYSVGESVCR